MQRLKKKKGKGKTPKTEGHLGFKQRRYFKCKNI